MASKWFLAVALLLAACGNADPANPVAAAAEVERPSPAAPISDNPHPAEMAIHCLRVVGAMITGPQAERCQAEHLWATATDRKGPLSDACLLHRLTLQANLVAKEISLIPQRSVGPVRNVLSVVECNQTGEVIQFAPFDYADMTEQEDKLEFVTFALRVMGEDAKWSILPTTDSLDLSTMCRAFEVATDQAIKRLAKEALECYLW